MNASRNPYEPPAARVADAVAPRPKPVTIAVALLWTQMSIEVLDKVLDARDGLQRGETVMLASNFTMVMMVLVCGLIFMIGRRRNWARITYALLFSLGMVVQIATWRTTLEGLPREMLAIILQSALQLAAMILVFQRVANAWFETRRSEA